MTSEKLTRAHKTLLHDRLKNIPTFLSEYSFANLYLFRQAHDYHVLNDGQEIFLSGKTYDERPFLMPTRDIRTSPVQKLIEIGQNYDFIFPIPEEWLSAFDGYSIESDVNEGDSDYVYSAEKMISLKGPQLHAKKNLLNQFLSLYVPDPRPLTPDRMADALDVLEIWQVDVGGPKSETDYYSCREAFELYEELVLCGAIYYVNDEPAGFIMGEEFNKSMFTLHFAKGKRKFKGMYQYMYNHFAKMLPQKYEYLNFEQDIGKLALKIAKSSYYPDRMLKKYRVRIVSP